MPSYPLNSPIRSVSRLIDPSLVAFIIVVSACLFALGSVWLPLTPSHEELIAYAGKLAWMKDQFAKGQFPTWWIGDFLGGFSGVAMLSYSASLLPYALLSGFLPDVEAFKIGGLLLLGLGALSARTFGIEFTHCRWTGSLIGLLYFSSAQLLMRLGWQEHMTIVTTFPLIPLTFWAMLRLSTTGAVKEALLLALSFSATLLCWSKMGATLAVPLAGFALWLFVSRSDARPRLIRGAMWAIPSIVVLGVLPLLPLLREFRWMTVFELGPFAGWQSMYSVKSAASWLDRGGDFFGKLPAMLSIDRGGYYLGVLQLLSVMGVVAVTWKNRVSIPAGFRAMLVLTLVMFWISFGPRSVIQGHFELMSGAYQLPDWSISIPWFALVAPGVFLWWVLPPSRWKPVSFSIFALVYYVISGFSWIEKFPLFSNLRAPDSFWILNGPFLWSVASGIAMASMLKTLQNRWLRSLAAITVCGLVLWDASGSARGFFSNGLPGALYRDFFAATEFLKNSDSKGRVFPVSGRYFYLGIPTHANRPLSTEAAHHNFMLRDTARLESAKNQSLKSLQIYLSLAGISHVFIDRNDPTANPEMEALFGSWMPKVFENAHFTIYENPVCLFPGFFSPSATRASNAIAENALAAAAIGVLLIDDSDAPEILEKPKQSGDLSNFITMDVLPVSAGRFRMNLNNTQGVVVLNQAWHPDWNATVDGQSTLVVKAASAFPAVEVKPENTTVEFFFVPPAWFYIAIFGGLFGWLVTIILLVGISVKNLIRRHHMPAQNESQMA